MGALTTYIRRWVEHGYNFDLAIVGGRGSGKSYAAITIAIILSHLFGRKFTAEYIHFQAITLLRHIHTLEARGELKPGMVFILDEAGCEGAADSQTWWDREVKALSQEMETYRKYNLIVIFTTPFLSNVTKRSREMFHGVLKPDIPFITDRFDLDEVKDNIVKSQQYSLWVFQRLETDPLPHSGTTNETLQWMMRTSRGGIGILRSIKIRIPPAEIREEYERMKAEYLREKRKEAITSIEKKTNINSISNEEVINRILNNREKYMHWYIGKWCLRKGIVFSEFGDYGIKGKRLKAIAEIIDYEVNKKNKEVKMKKEDGEKMKKKRGRPRKKTDVEEEKNEEETHTDTPTTP